MEIVMFKTYVLQHMKFTDLLNKQNVTNALFQKLDENIIARGKKRFFSFPFLQSFKIYLFFSFL